MASTDDLVTNSSPFGSRYTIDKQSAETPKDVVEKIQTTPSKNPQHRQKKVKKISKPVVVTLIVIVGLVLTGILVASNLIENRGSASRSASATPTPSPQGGNETRTNPQPTLFTNPLDGTRHFMAVGLVILTFLLSIVLIMIAIKKGLEAIGRNPMAAKHVKQSLLLVSLVLFLIIGVGLGIAYFLFYGNPPPTHTRMVAPTLPPSLPEGTQNNVFTTNCLTVSVPLKTNYPKLQLQDNRCTLSFTVLQPRGNFTLTYRPIPEHLFDQDPSVSMRRVYADKYTEFDMAHPRFARILAFKTNTEQTYFLRDQDDHHFELTFHGFQAGYESEVTPEIIYYLLDSIQLPETPREDTLGVSGSQNSQ